MKVEYCTKCNNITNISLSKEDASYVINGDSSDWCSCSDSKASPRDTQFAGFAHLVLMELVDNHSMALDWDKSFLEIKQIITRRAYDLVKHTIAYADPKDLDALSFGEAVGRIPDMTEWLEEEEE